RLDVAARGCGGRGRYANSMVGRSGVKPCRDCAAGHDTGHRARGNWLQRKSIAKTVVEEGGRRDRFDGEAERCAAPGSTQSFRVGQKAEVTNAHEAFWKNVQ